MTDYTDLKFEGKHGTIVFHKWEPTGDPDSIVLIVHGYSEHAGRYDHVARALVDGLNAVVYAPDLMGHGRSDGDRASVTDFDDLVADVHAVAKVARDDHPKLPLALIGHAMGAVIATVYATERTQELDALVLASPLIGGKPAFQEVLDTDPMPEISIDPSLLSRDESVGEAYAADELVYHGPFKRATLEALVTAIGKIAAADSLGVLPLLWIHGQEDQVALVQPAREAITSVAGQQFDDTVYPGARHELFHETNKDEVIGDVVRFLTRAFQEAQSGTPGVPSPQDELVDSKDAGPQPTQRFAH